VYRGVGRCSLGSRHGSPRPQLTHVEASTVRCRCTRDGTFSWLGYAQFGTADAARRPDHPTGPLVLYCYGSTLLYTHFQSFTAPGTHRHRAFPASCTALVPRPAPRPPGGGAAAARLPRGSWGVGGTPEGGIFFCCFYTDLLTNLLTYIEHSHRKPISFTEGTHVRQPSHSTLTEVK